MNYKMTLFVMGRLMGVVGLFMLLPIAVGLIYGESHVFTSFGIPILILLFFALVFSAKKSSISIGIQRKAL